MRVWLLYHLSKMFLFVISLLLLSSIAALLAIRTYQPDVSESGLGLVNLDNAISSVSSSFCGKASVTIQSSWVPIVDLIQPLSHSRSVQALNLNYISLRQPLELCRKYACSTISPVHALNSLLHGRRLSSSPFCGKCGRTRKPY